MYSFIKEYALLAMEEEGKLAFTLKTLESLLKFDNLQDFFTDLTSQKEEVIRILEIVNEQ